MTDQGSAGWAGRVERATLFAVGAVVVVRIWLMRMPATFSCDEAGLIWVISGGPSEILSRATQFPQSLAYCYLASALDHIGGPREVVLRFPSLLAAILTVVALFRLGERVLGPIGARYAVAVWLLLPTTFVQPVQARPYAIGLLLITLAYVDLVHWLAEPTRDRVVRGVLSCVGAIYFGYFFALSAAAIALTALIACARSTTHRPQLRLVLAMLPLAVVLLAPLTPSAWAAFETRVTHAYAPRPALQDLFTSLVPAPIGLGLVTGAVLHLLHTRAERLTVELPAPLILLAIGAGAMLPILAVFLMSLPNARSIFVSHYMIGATIPLALAYGGWIAKLTAPARAVALAVLFVTAVPGRITLGRLLPHVGRDWRAASRYLVALPDGGTTELLATSPFVETRFIEYPPDLALQDCLLAPLVAYPPGRSYRLIPQDEGTATEPFCSALLQDLRERPRPLLVLVSQFALLPVWLSEGLRDTYQVTRVLDADGLLLFRLDPTRTP